jgi:hypothetical protein
MKKLKELKKGELFKRKEYSPTWYVRDIYIRECKKYSCHKWEDINSEILLKGETTVYTD